MRTATATVAPKAITTAAIARTRLLIVRWVAQGPDQPGGDHADDQQRDSVEAESADVAVGPEAQAAVHDHVDRHRGEEAAEHEAKEQQRVSEIGIHLVDG